MYSKYSSVHFAANSSMMATASVSSAFHQERTENGQSSISPNFSNYPKGALLSITLENFMIHDRLRLEFGSSCNLIMGPNGNGKSSILCGLVIGLGGDPKKILKRGRKLEHFIKSTSKEARIKVRTHHGMELQKTKTKQNLSLSLPLLGNRLIS